MHVPLSGRYRAAIAAAILVAFTAGIGQQTTVGTVKSVDTDKREVTVIAGRGYALRAIVFQLQPVADQAAVLSSVKPGTVVEVHHRKVEGREVALSITVLPPKPEGPLP